MPRNPTSSGWYVVDGARRYWSGDRWNVPSQFMVDPGGDLPVWNADDSDELVAERMVTTLPTVPGYRIVEVRSVVTELSATPGTSAESKGNAALAAALRGIRATARGTHGANAIVGLSASVFAAHAVGIGAGDAVGVLLTGTAVVVEPDA